MRWTVKQWLKLQESFEKVMGLFLKCFSAIKNDRLFIATLRLVKLIVFGYNIFTVHSRYCIHFSLFFTP